MESNLPDGLHSSPLEPHRRSRVTGLIVAAVGVVIALGVVVGVLARSVPSSSPTAPGTAATGRVQTSAAAPPSPTTPPSTHRAPMSPRPTATRIWPNHVGPLSLGRVALTEATDLAQKPRLGQAWRATDGAPNDGLRPYVYVTPCGVLVNVLYPDPGVHGVTPTPRALGYDVATGSQLWSLPLRLITGLANPTWDMSGDPTFTPDCKMVIGIGENYDVFGEERSAWIDLRTGAWGRIGVGPYARCAAAGSDWAGCWNNDVGTLPISLVNPSSTPPWSSDSMPVAYESSGDPVVVHGIATPEGYRDPATGEVKFGKDVYFGDADGTVSRVPVVYLEPRLASGVRSGLVVRVEGFMREDSAVCQATLWDPSTDRAAWPTSQKVPCGRTTDLGWGAAGSVLVVTTSDGQGLTRQAFSIADGKPVWAYDAPTGSVGSTPWVFGMAYLDSVSGLSENFTFPGKASYALRNGDGAKVKLQAGHLYAAADTIMYDIARSGSPLTVTAEEVGAAGALTRLWTLSLDAGATEAWTFAVNGRMYVVTTDAGNQITVTPLIVG